MYSDTQRNLGGHRPVGYGRPPSSQPEHPAPGNGYGQPPSNGGLNRLISSIAGAQRARTGQELTSGFQNFSYNEAKINGSINGLFRNTGGEQPLSDEQYRINTIEQVSFKSNELLGFLVNRYGRYFQTVRSAMNYFSISKVTQKPDPVCAEFIEEVVSNQDFYRYCCTYACLFFTSHVTNYVLCGRSEELLKNESLQFDILSSSFIDVLGLTFTAWLESHPNAIMLNQKMFPETRARLESFETKIDELRNALINISVGPVQIPFPWKKGVLQRIVDKTHSGSATYETHQMYNDSTVVDTNGWGVGTVSGGTVLNTSSSSKHISPLTSSGEVNLDWLDSVACDTSNQGYAVKPKTQAYEFTNSVVNDNWDDAPSVNRKPEMETISSINKDLTELAKKVNPYSRLDYNPRTWFKPLPETNCYIVHPDHMKVLAASLQYDPDMEFEYSHAFDVVFKFKPDYMPAYDRYSWEEKGRIPVVRLDWHKGTYAFYNLHVGRENVEPMLTNPDKVLPYVSSIKAGTKPAKYNTIDFDEVLNSEPEQPSFKVGECKPMDTTPTVVYGNSVAVVENNQEVINTIDNTAKVAKAKRQDTEAVAVGMQSMIPVQFENVTTEMIEAHLPYLMKGNTDKLNCENFCDSMIAGIRNIGSKDLAYFVISHLTNVTNRWLVEKRFYSEDKNDPNYLQVHNILENYQELIDGLRDKDPATRAILMQLGEDEFLMNHFRVFSSSVKRDEFIKCKIENAKTVYDKEQLKLEAPDVIYIERDFIVVNILPMNPPEPGQTKDIICGSEVPQIKWIEENIPEYMQKYFSKCVPILVRFAKDDSPRLWALTRSGYCDSKFTLRQLSFQSIIPLMKVMSD